MSLVTKWLELKEKESQLAFSRRVIELAFASEGSDDPNYEVVKKERVKYHINSDLLIELIHENGLEAHLNTLFKWIPTLNEKNYYNCDKKITDLLEPAITREDKLPSFTIVKKGE